MNINKYINKLKNVEEKSRLENAYSHIVYELFDDVLDTDKYAIVDTSSLKRDNKNSNNIENTNGNKSKIIAPNDAIAVPDFVITSNDYRYKTDIYNDDSKSKILGCIEVKYNDTDVIKSDRLKNNADKRGYLAIYKKVIYTNGWIWKYYDNSKNSPEVINFRENPTNEEYDSLLKMLCSINWGG